MLMEPIFSQIYGLLLGLDNPPGLITYLGTFIILTGLFILLVFENNENASNSSIIDEEEY
jgi:drug/metabolite transporter (DMT)-like permease